MARLADYSIITDQWVLERDQDTIHFDVPSTIHSGSRCVLGFMLNVVCLDDTTVTLRLNGDKVFEWTYSEGGRTQFFQEVIGAGILQGGDNVLSWDTWSSEPTAVRLSDAVVWWQAN